MNDKAKTQVTLWLNPKQVEMVRRIEKARMIPRASVFKRLLEEETERLEKPDREKTTDEKDADSFWERWQRNNPGEPLPE